MTLYNLCTEKGIHLSKEQALRIEEFGALVVKYNKKTNLISESDEVKITTRHLFDSLQPIRIPELVPNKGIWADMGSGAGFPIIPLSIALPQIQFIAIEPRLKRQTFLKTVARELGIENFQLFAGNAEESGIKNVERVSCRALGTAEEDWERAEKMLASEGVFITLKSRRDAEMLHDFCWKVFPYDLPGESQTYAIVTRNKQ